MKHSDLISAAYDPELTAALLNSLANSLRDHLTSVQKGDGPVSTWREPTDNIALADEYLQLPTADTDIDSVCEKFGQLAELSLSRGQNLNHPHYIGHQVPAPLPMAGVFDAITTITNQVQGVYEMGPWAVSVERALIDRIGKTIGFDDGFGGLVTSGGSLANVTALLTARNKSVQDCWSRGVANTNEQPVIVASADAHYCVDRAAGVLGLGTNQVVRVGLDDQRRMDARQLDLTLDDLRQRSVPVVAVVAVAGATPTGAFDPLTEIHAVCDRHNVWMHVDAAHGGAVCMSTTHRHLVEGLQLADSVVLDAHKMMFLPALCAFVFYKDGRNRFAAFEQSAPYLFDPSAPDMAEYDNGVVTFECTKRAAALGLWGVWSTFGPQLFESLVDNVFATAQTLHDLISADPDFEALDRPSSNIVVFRFLPPSEHQGTRHQINQLQLALRRKINRDGAAYLTQTTIDDHVYLRSTIMNPLTGVDHLRQILDQLRTVGESITTLIASE